MLKIISGRLLSGVAGRKTISCPLLNHVNRWCSSSQEQISSIYQELQRNDQAIAYGENAIKRVSKVLLGAGFTPENCSTIIDKYTNILRIHAEDVENRIEMWNSCQFTKTQFYDLFIQCPELIEFNDPNALSKRLGQLRSIVSTPKNIWRLLMASPNVLVDNFQSIQTKVDYVTKDMEADVTDLVKSGTLGLPLKKIKTRHMLLVRLGIYKKRNFKASELSSNKNPRLFRIMDVDDEEFASKTCKISFKELEAFSDLYERELEEIKESEIDYDDFSDIESGGESDSDDDDFDARDPKDYYDDRKKRRYKKDLQFKSDKRK